jgi:preprotein translocase subunit SecA
MPTTVVPAEAVAATIDAFTALDASGDKKSMNKMARRLGKEQPALLAFAAKHREEHGEQVGEAAVFYGTLVWAMFDRNHEGTLPRLTESNLEEAEKIVRDELDKVEGLGDKEIHERTASPLVDRQPQIYEKLAELIAEDVKEEAITADCAEVIFPATQIVVEAFDAALDGRRPGEQQGTIVREQPKVGRNEPCPCGSGKKYKKCCGKAA